MSNTAVDLTSPPPVAQDRACNICGSNAFLPGFLGRLANGIPPYCATCKTVERHRAVWDVYAKLRPITGKWRVLHFAPDGSVDPKWFATYRKSIFGTQSSLNMMDTGLPDGSFELVISNHVLEHVPDHVAALAETLRLVGKDGAVHAMVPAQSWSLDDWGFPDPARNEHWREFGADFALSVVHSIPGVHAAGVIAADPITAVADVIYFFSRSPASLMSIHRMLPRVGIQVVRFS